MRFVALRLHVSLFFPPPSNGFYLRLRKNFKARISSRHLRQPNERTSLKTKKYERARRRVTVERRYDSSNSLLSIPLTRKRPA